ncbi:MAG: Ig-like domain-containing protein, partial [Acidobacteria bacterium]|nr:Ig-like domain-containing protein [Acidobacteriota bacterium]
AASGAPIAGATVTVLGTVNQATTDANGAFTLTQPAGTFSLLASAAGFANATTAPFTLAPGATLAVGAIRLSTVALAVYVGYGDNLRPSGAFPIPWQGAPNVVFLGKGPVFDAGAIRLDNNTGQAIMVDQVSVDLHRPGPVFSLWGSFAVPAHGTVILTQQQPFGFDTSDYPIVGCGQSVATNDPRVPKVTVTVGGAGTDYFDTGHILDTGGFDTWCQGGANESLQWRLIGTTGVSSNGDFTLAPASGSSALGTPYTLTATLTDANNQPLPNVAISFQATAGPNVGQAGQAVTGAAGQASFSYASRVAGTDTWVATAGNQSGGALTTNPVTVTWPPLGGIQIFVAYADTVRPNATFPTPWEGDPNIVSPGYRPGTGPPWDAGAIRLDNTTAGPLQVDKVTVDLQRPGPVYDLWGSFTIPVHGSAILTQTIAEGAGSNFDTSDFPISPCNQPAPPSDPRIPKITVTIGGLTASYLDSAHILDHFGWDTYYSCGGGSDPESLQWRPLGVSGTQTAGQLALFPNVATTLLGAPYTATAIVTDAAGEPLANVTVQFAVLSGPNAGRSGQAVTDTRGTAPFSYSGSVAGVDTVKATITNQSGAAIVSNVVSATWVGSVTLNLTPASAAQAVGTPYNATLVATDGSGNPVPNLAVTFQVASGPSAGTTVSGTTGSGGQAVFTYTSLTAGTDASSAAVTGQGGTTVVSNQVTATWTSPLSLTLAPVTVSQPVGTAATFTATLLDGGGHPIPNVGVSFSVSSGPDAGTQATATTGAGGQAMFSLTGAGPGADLVQATAGTGGGVASNPATAVWTAIPTAALYTGPTFGDYGDPLTLAARLIQATTGQPLAGQTLSFTFGTQTLTAVTDATGTAVVSLTPTTPPGAVPLAVVFAGSVGYGGSAASVLIAIHRDDTALAYTGPIAVANGQPQPLSAVLTDPQTHAPLAGKTVTFGVGSVTASGTTDATGTATASLTLPASAPTGPSVLQVAFAGDATEVPAATTVPVVVYQPASFVIWGGNTPGLALGQYVNFWGSQWASQVTGGDYQANPSFKGYAVAAMTPAAICEPTAHTSGSPLLDSSCWTSKPGNSKPPATLPAYIGVIVSTSIAKQGSTI